MHTTPEAYFFFLFAAPFCAASLASISALFYLSEWSLSTTVIKWQISDHFGICVFNVPFLSGWYIYSSIRVRREREKRDLHGAIYRVFYPTAWVPVQASPAADASWGPGAGIYRGSP